MRNVVYRSMVTCNTWFWCAAGHHGMSREVSLLRVFWRGWVECNFLSRYLVEFINEAIQAWIWGGLRRFESTISVSLFPLEWALVVCDFQGIRFIQLINYIGAKFLVTFPYYSFNVSKTCSDVTSLVPAVFTLFSLFVMLLKAILGEGLSILKLFFAKNQLLFYWFPILFFCSLHYCFPLCYYFLPSAYFIFYWLLFPVF